MRISTRAKSVMRQYQNISGGGQTGARGMGSSLSFDDIVNLSVAVEEKKKHKPNGETVGEQLEYEPTPEDISRMKDTVSRVRRKDQDQPNPAISP